MIQQAWLIFTFSWVRCNISKKYLSASWWADKQQQLALQRIVWIDFTAVGSADKSVLVSWNRMSDRHVARVQIIEELKFLFHAPLETIKVLRQEQLIVIYNINWLFFFRFYTKVNNIVFVSLCLAYFTYEVSQAHLEGCTHKNSQSLGALQDARGDVGQMEHSFLEGIHLLFNCVVLILFVTMAGCLK